MDKGRHRRLILIVQTQYRVTSFDKFIAINGVVFAVVGKEVFGRFGYCRLNNGALLIVQFVQRTL